MSYSETFNQTHLADAYERLLLETMRGIQALFVRRDEVEEAWKWVDSITESLGSRPRCAETVSGRSMGTGCVGGHDHSRRSFMERVRVRLEANPSGLFYR